MIEIGQRRLPDKIREALIEYFTSNKSMKQVAKEHHINYGHFTMWANRIRVYDAEGQL